MPLSMIYLKVKDFSNWKRLIFEDRAILKSDLRYMAKSQVQALENLPVLLVEDNGKTLVIEYQ